MPTPDILSNSGVNQNMPPAYTDYPIPPQAVPNRGNSRVDYWVPYDAYMPQQAGSVPPGTGKKSKAAAASNTKEQYRQLAATSVNVRNRALSEILNRM